ncbi:MAG: glycosyltransferase [Candidatus Bilamarchaeaceae archaeon]
MRTLSIIIPTKNEPLIQELVNDINSKVKVAHEIIVVDKSTELPKLHGAKVIRQKSDGLGNAFLEGLAIAKGDVVALMDGDGSHDPADIPKLLEKLQNYDIVIGSKFLPGGKTEDPLSRVLVSKAFALITRILLRIDLKDPMTGFMVAKRDVLNRVKFNPKGYKIVIETICKSKAPVAEVPITFHARKAGESKVGFNLRGLKEAMRILSLLFELRRYR